MVISFGSQHAGRPAHQIVVAKVAQSPRGRSRFSLQRALCLASVIAEDRGHDWLPNHAFLGICNLLRVG
jgi:hypothetical protein